MRISKNKFIGLILILLSIPLFFVILDYIKKIKYIVISECETLHGQVCAIHETYFPWQGYVGFSIVLLIFIFGIYLFFKKEEKIKIKKAPKDLRKDEKKVYELIAKEGAIFQSDIIDKLGFNKVKVTRILDRLEGKQLVERKRRGMANIVVLKSGE